MPLACANISMLFTELPFLERLGAAAAHGFRFVEAGADVYRTDLAELTQAAARANVSFVLLNMPAGNVSIYCFIQFHQQFFALFPSSHLS